MRKYFIGQQPFSLDKRVKIDFEIHSYSSNVDDGVIEQ